MTRLPFALLTLALAPGALVSQQTSFAVVPFEAQQSFGLDQETLSALGGGIAQILASELSLSPGGSAAPRSATAGAISSQALAKTARIDAATAAQIGKLV